MKFKSCLLKEIADVQTGPFGSQLHKKDYVVGGTPIITVEHLGENNILYQNLPGVKDEDVERLKKYKLQKNDIVFSRVGSVDRRALVSEAEDGWLFSGRCLRVRVKDESVNPVYLSYYFGLPAFKEYIRSIAVGATMPSINTKILSNIEVEIPEKRYQNQIASLLHCIDLKVWNNEDAIALLEKMAQTLFKHWFIDFEFPDAEDRPYKSSGGKMVESELGKIPEGWEVKELKDIASDSIVCGKTPSTKMKEYYGGKIPFITIPDMHKQIFAVQTAKYLTKRGGDSQKTKYIPAYSICVSCIATPGLVVITSEESQTNQQINSFVPHENDLYYLYLTMKRSSDLIRELGSGGSTTLNLNKSQFSKIKVLDPSERIKAEFNKKVSACFEKIHNLQKQNLTLEKLRDSLLPKLLSGEIELPLDDEVTVHESV